MTKNELEKEAREYLAEHSKYSEVFDEIFVAVDTLTAMVDFAEPREKRIAELEAQIEKMKCCYNCKHSRTEYEHCKTPKNEKWELKEE
jgi:hypothetical protein